VKRGGLRAALYGVTAALLGGAGLLWLEGCGIGPALRLSLSGIILFGTLSFERWRYQPIDDHPPGRGWVATGERFVDPESSRLVTVYHRSATGERRYVESSPRTECGPLAGAGAAGYDAKECPRSSGG
jgi:hypothetical protein